MSSYTMELRTFIEHQSQGSPSLSIKEKIELGRKELFNFNYPFFDKDYKNVFETNFIRNFYMREIGFETESLFQFQLETWLLINMPYFNKLFESELFQYDPLQNYDLETTHTRKNNGTRNDFKDTLQNNNKDILQTEGKDITHRDNKDVTQNDRIDKSQNNRNDKHQNDRIDKQQNYKIDRTQGDVIDVDTVNNTIQSSTIKGSSKALNTSLVDTKNNKTNTDTIIVDNFGREVKSDTPDGRLNLTTQEGKGVILYANMIEEDYEKNKTTNEGKSDVKDTTNIKEDNTSTTTQDSDSKTDDVGNSLTTHDMSGSEILNRTDDETIESTIDETLNMTGNEILSSNIGEISTSAINETASTKVGETNLTSVDEKLSSEVKDLEEFVERKVGSAGVKTYPELIEGYRSILLRVEKQIFYEMNELFMLVY